MDGWISATGQLKVLYMITTMQEIFYCSGNIKESNDNFQSQINQKQLNKMFFLALKAQCPIFGH